MVFGITLLVAGVAQQLEVSGAIGAFLVGLALSLILVSLLYQRFVFRKSRAEEP